MFFQSHTTETLQEIENRPFCREDLSSQTRNLRQDHLGTNFRSTEADSVGVSLLAQAATRLEATTPSLRYLAVALAKELGATLNLTDLVSEEDVASTSVVVVGPEWLTEHVTEAVSQAWPTVSAWGTTERALEVVDAGKLRSAGLVVIPPAVTAGATAVLGGVGLRPGSAVRSASSGPAAHLVEIERWLATQIGRARA